MRYGIIGTSRIAKYFIDGARLVTGAEIAAVYSRTAEKGEAFASENAIPMVYTNLDDFSKGDFEAVYIASPNAFHYAYSIKMIEAGKHVICEKPLAVNPREIRECAEKAKEKGVIYTEAIMYMHSPDRDVFRKAVSEIGNITSAHFEFSQLSSRYTSYLSGEMPNIFNPSLAAGCLMDLGVYCVYPAVDLFGMPDKINADAVFLRTGADGSGNASLNYGDKLVTLTYSKTGQNHFGSSVYGDKGTVTVESISKTVNIKLYENNGNVTSVCGDRIKEEIMGFEASEFERFIVNPGDPKYFLCTETSVKVSEIMESIRNICGIKFN